MSGPVMNGLDVVTVRVAQEHPGIAGVVLRPLPRGVQHLRPRGERGGGAASTAPRSGARKATCSSRASAPAAGLSQKLGTPSEPASPITNPGPLSKRIISPIPSGANTRR